MPKILLADDNEMNRDMLSRRLRHRGYEVVVAVDGAEAVAQAASTAPDLILMDLSMPVQDGWQATAQIKDSPATQQIPVIALTAHRINAEDALMAGFDGYAIKPVELADLLKQIESLLGTAPGA